MGELGSERLRAAIWRASGTFEVLDNDPDTTTRPHGLSDSDDVLVWMANTRTATRGFAVISHGVVSVPDGFRERGFI